MEAIAAAEAQTQTDVVQRTGIDRGTLSGIVRRLKKDGLVLRRRAMGDARAYELFLTPSGTAALQQTRKAVVHAEAMVRQRLPEIDALVARNDTGPLLAGE